MKDLGVIIDCKLKFQDHVKQKINKAYSILGILRRNFKEMDVDSFISLYKLSARCHLEYAESVWNPHYMYLIDDLEKVQKRPTEILRQCRRLYYRQCLEFLNLLTLAFRRNRGVMIEVYKILTGKYDPTLPSILHCNINSTTRGNALKLSTYHPKYDLCKYYFTVRVISLWNILPTHVITAVSVDSFKNRLDKFWANEEARFDYKANLSGCGFARCF